MTSGNDSSTTVLPEGYSDFQDSVVDRAHPFDPAAFSAAQGSSSYATEYTVVGSYDETIDLGAGAAYGSGGAPLDDWGDSGARTWDAAPAVTQRPPSVAQSGPWPSVPQVTPSMMAASVKPPRDSSSALIGVIVALVVVAVVAIAVAVAFALAPANQDSSPSPVTSPVVVSASSSSSASNSTSSGREVESTESSTNYHSGDSGSSHAIVVSGDARDQAEREAYELLGEYYDLAGDYDKKITSCAKEFDEYVLKEDKSVRSSKASTVSSLKRRIESSQDELSDVELPFMSKNKAARDDLITLYECLYCRIDAIDRAWKVSLTFEKPEEHKSEIMEPITADQVQGENKYYTRFKELYPNVKLVKP